MSRGISVGTMSTGFASGMVYSTTSPGESLSFFLPGFPLRSTSPCSSSFWAALRVRPSPARAQTLPGPGQEGIQPFPGGVGDQAHLCSSFQKSLWKKARCTITSTQPQVMKQSATLNTGKSMKVVSNISTT